MSKSFRDMSNEELRAEWYMWDDKIKNATSWGASLAAADEFRKACARELNRRGVNILNINAEQT